MSNKYTNTRIEFHILQSFPVSCLNRDDVGSPKTAIIGGVQRARVSSQCWKRAVRLAMQDLGIVIANRTRYVTAKIQEQCTLLGASDEQARSCGEAAAAAFTKKVTDGVSDTLFFISDSEAKALATAFAEKNFTADAIAPKALQKLCNNAINPAHDGLDIALFGRMVASAPEMNIEAAASFAHAISTHKAIPEIDFFTAVDDCRQDDQTGSGHMGTIEFNSATYYRYVSLDLGQLAANLKANEVAAAVAAFVKALFIAVPAARQATMAAASPWDFARIILRKGQRLQMPFNAAVKTSKEYPDLVSASKAELLKQLDDKEKMYGSMYGKLADFSIGMDAEASIDDVLDGLLQNIEKI